MLRVHLGEADLPLTPTEQKAFIQLPFDKGDVITYVSLSCRADEDALIAHVRRFLEKMPSQYGSVHVSIHGTPMKLDRDEEKEVDPWARVSDARSSEQKATK